MDARSSGWDRGHEDFTARRRTFFAPVLEAAAEVVERELVVMLLQGVNLADPNWPRQEAMLYVAQEALENISARIE